MMMVMMVMMIMMVINRWHEITTLQDHTTVWKWLQTYYSFVQLYSLCLWTMLVFCFPFWAWWK